LKILEEIRKEKEVSEEDDKGNKLNIINQEQKEDSVGEEPEAEIEEQGEEEVDEVISNDAYVYLKQNPKTSMRKLSDFLKDHQNTDYKVPVLK